MTHSDSDRTLALAGVFQAAQLVQQIGVSGHCDGAALEASINAVFKTSPDSVEAVYGSRLCLTPGLQSLARELDGRTSQRNVELTRYVLGLLYLERKLFKRKDMLDAIATGIERAKAQLAHFPPTHSNVLANLADVYSNTLSTLSPRIMVHGEHQHLNNPDNANKIRALLLSGIRSAVLWRQCGGARWTLLFGRNKLVAQAKHFLHTAEPPSETPD